MAITLSNFITLKQENPKFQERRKLNSGANVSFDELVNSCVDFADCCFDIVSERMFFDNDFNFYFSEGDGGYYKAEISYWAFSQLCQIHNISVTFLEKLVSDGKIALAVKILNEYLSNEKQLTVRCCFINSEGAFLVRGIVSTQFALAPTATILQDIQQNVDLSPFTINSYYNDSERFQLRLTHNVDLAEIKKASKVGDRCFGGVILDNSEVGQSALNLRFFVYRLVCSNGLIVTEFIPDFVFKMKHKGNVNADGIITGFNLFKDASELVDNSLAMTALDTSYSNDKLILDKDGKPTYTDDSEAKKFLNSMKKDLSLSKGEIAQIEKIVYVDYSNFETRFALMNAITQFAHQGNRLSPDIEKRSDLERYAARLLVDM